jgi:signal peptidase I
MTGVLAVTGSLVLALAALVFLRRRYTLITVTGASMQPTLEDGDRVLIRAGGIRPGQLVVARRPWPGQRWADPQPGPLDGASWLVKRVADREAEAGAVWLLGDNPDRSYDSRQWGPCPPGKVRGVVVKVFRTGSRDRPAPVVPAR